MAFCKNCGQEIQDGAQFCGACGTPVDAAPQQEAPQQATPQPQAAPMSEEADVASSRGVAWLSYLGPLFLIPFFVKKTSKFARFHVRQGATLCALEIAYNIAKGILMLPIDLATRSYYYGFYYHNWVYHMFNTILNLAQVFFLVVAIIGIVNAANGRKTELPLISKIPFIAKLMDKWYTSMGIDVTND